MNKYIPYIIVFVIGFLLAWFSKGTKEITNTIEVKSDTVTIVKTQTIRDSVPKYISKIVKDTIEIPCNDGDSVVRLPIEQKFYSKPNMYDVWVSGYNADLDSIKIFNKIEYKTITNTINNTKYVNSSSLYGYVGLSKFDGKFIPMFDLIYSTKGNISFGGSIGLIDNKPIYGLKFGYKLK